MSFTKQVMTGLAAGILLGLFIGERAAPMQLVASGFVKLLQMTVLPYVVLSIICSLGSLSYEEARRLGVRVGMIILGLWVVTLLYIMIIPLTFPSMESGTFFSTSQLEKRHEFNFVDLYIPANPFHSLANNVVPAIVLFSVVLGVALIGVPEKQRLLDVLQILIKAISRATRFIVKLTPLGIFAIAAHAAGTLSLEQLGRIEIFLIAYVAVTLLLALWVLPGLVSALTPIPMRDVFAPNRSALVTAFVAGDIFIVLPSLMESCEQTLIRNRVGQHEEHKLPEVIVPASFNFPHTGKLLSLSFVLFAGWFADSALSLRDYPQLAVAGVLSIFGSMNSAIPFLLDLFRIPADTFQLFLATGVINARFGSLLAAVHLIVVALLGTAALAGAVKFQAARLLRFGLVTLALTGGTVVGLKVLFERTLRPQFDGAGIVNNLKPLFPAPAPAFLPADAPSIPKHPGGLYESIVSRGLLRVGYFNNRLPFAYRNKSGDLVGFDIEAANLLAHELGVKLELIHIDPDRFETAMDEGKCDIIMSSVALTPRREARALFSRPYFDQTLGFAVPDHRREEFLTWESIAKQSDLRVAAPNVWHYLQVLSQRLPKAKIVPLNLDEVTLGARADLDVYAMPAEVASAQTLLHPKFSVVVPGPDPIRIPVAYPLAHRDEVFRRIVNDWIELRQKDGTFNRLYRHWILGESAVVREPRWSILDNVLRKPRH